MTPQNLPAPRDGRPPVPIPAANVVYAYPLTQPPTQSLADAARVVQDALGIITEMGDRLATVLRRPYPCIVCTVDLSGLADWQRRRHFVGHPLSVRAEKVGWFRAVMGP
jgi:hypothetical protein